MSNPIVSNPKDYQVVSFHNSTDFGFTPEMGCMYDGRGINGVKGSPGIDAGETIVLPYHIGHRLATNLAKRVLNVSPAATLDAAGVPTGVAIWNPEKLEELKNTFLKDLYSEEKPIAQSQTDLLMQKVEEYKKMTEELLARNAPKEEPKAEKVEIEKLAEVPKTFSDKQEVLAELEKRGIKHDKRSNKETLKKLLA